MAKSGSMLSNEHNAIYWEEQKKKELFYRNIIIEKEQRCPQFLWWYTYCILHLLLLIYMRKYNSNSNAVNRGYLNDYV